MKKVRNQIAALFIVAAMVMGLFAPAQFAEAASGVKINSTNFPDSQFRKAVKKYDTNKDGKLSTTELKKLKVLYLYNDASKEIYKNKSLLLVSGVKKAKGVEKLTYLTEIYIFGQKDVSYDFTKCRGLKKLKVSENYNVKTIKVNGLKNLTSLAVSECGKIKTIDISKCKAIKEASVDHCESFTKLKTSSSNTKLVGLYVYGDKVSSVDLSNLTKLKYLNVSFNRGLKEVDLSSLNNLVNLNLAGNDYNETTLDLSAMNNIESIEVNETNIDTLKLPENPRIVRLYTYHSAIKSLDLSKNTASYCYMLPGSSTEIILPEETYSFNDFYTGDKFTVGNKFTLKSLKETIIGTLGFDEVDYYYMHGDITNNCYDIYFYEE